MRKLCKLCKQRDALAGLSFCNDCKQHPSLMSDEERAELDAWEEKRLGDFDPDWPLPDPIENEEGPEGFDYEFDDD